MGSRAPKKRVTLTTLLHRKGRQGFIVYLIGFCLFFPALVGGVLNTLLDPETSLGDSIGFIGIFLVLVGWTGYAAWSRWRGLRSLEDHPEVKRLSRFGDPSEVLRLIDDEMTSDQAVRIGDVILTDNWVVVARDYDATALATQTIAWVYENVTTTRLWFVLPIERTRTIMVHLDDGRTHSLPGSKRRNRELIEEMAARSNAVVGYSEELAQAFKKTLRAGS